jgi:predicted negative regulator of RcsB-dependent stress response
MRTTPRRRWFASRLRTLLVVVAVALAGVMAWRWVEENCDIVIEHFTAGEPNKAHAP